MATVDPADDAIRRFVVWHYRYDALRGERRNVTVAAVDDETEFRWLMDALTAELGRRKELGDAEPAETVGGVILEPGSSAMAKQSRQTLRSIRSRAAPRKE